METKKDLAIEILNRYESCNGELDKQTYADVAKRLQKCSIENLQGYIDYICKGSQPNIDTAYVIAVSTKKFLHISK